MGEVLSAVMAARDSVMAVSSDSRVRALAERSHCLTFDQASSMGERHAAKAQELCVCFP